MNKKAIHSQGAEANPNGKKVACGDWKLDSLDTNEQKLTVTQIVNHPAYNPSTFVNDIALIKVSGSFNCQPRKLWPACLPSTNVSTNSNKISANNPSAVFCKSSFVAFLLILCYRNTPTRAGRIR